MHINSIKLIHGALLLALTLLTACGGGGGGAAPSASTYTIGGTVTGLTGTGLVLQNNGGDNLTVASGAASFTFSTALASAATYNVTVLTQPIGQICSVNPYTGTVAAANVTNVVVTCAAAANTYTIGGIVTNLTGTGLVLQKNGSDNLPISASGAFVFATPQANGTTYTVTVQAQPSGQVCSVNPFNGTVAGANVTSVAVTCAATASTYTIGGSVSGLTGTGLVLQNNGGDDRTVVANATAFTFSTALASAATYAVTVQTQPSGQTCTVSNGTGTVATANVTNVVVTCATTTTLFTIGGSVSGLSGTVVLQNNGGDNLSISTNGTFVFATPRANGYLYVVSVLTQPTGQTCLLASNVGTVASANVTSVTVTCAANPYTIGGSVDGLLGTVVLQNNGGDDLSISANGNFTFATKIANGAPYAVTVLTQPTGQTCTVNSPSGIVVNAAVTNVAVVCSGNNYTVGGGVFNLVGSGLVLQNNLGDDLTVASGITSYTFATPLAHGSAYAVTVKTQPSSPNQLCTVTASGIITANVINADVSCVNTYTIGGTITGAAAGIGPILQNNLGDNLFIPAITTGSTSFTFSTPIADGASYSVTQRTPARAPAQNCSSITNGSGNVSAAAVTNVSITCMLSTIVPKFAYVTNSIFNTIPLAADTVSAYAIGVGGDLTAPTPDTTASGDQPYAVAVDPTGQFAYVVNLGGNSVSVYGIDLFSGALTPVDADGVITGTQPSIPTGDTPISIAIDPSGKFAYVANQGIAANTLSAYSVNLTTGALSAIDADGATGGIQVTIATGTKPNAVVVDPLGRFVYVANDSSNNVSAYTINQATGELTEVVGSPFAAGTNPRSVAIEPTGKFAFVANAGGDVTAYSIDAVTGTLTQIVCTSNGISNCSGNNYLAGSAPRSIAVDPSTGMYAYVANAGGGVSAFEINPATGELSAVDADAVTGGADLTIAAGTTPISINVDPSGQFVYVANFGSNTISVYSVNLTTGALTLLQTLTTGSGPTSVTTTQ